MTAGVERRAACGASYNACASGATPCKFETRQPARPAEKRGRTVNFNGELARFFFGNCYLKAWEKDRQRISGGITFENGPNLCGNLGAIRFEPRYQTIDITRVDHDGSHLV